jgi:signal transduction histidine kinase
MMIVLVAILHTPGMPTFSRAISNTGDPIPAKDRERIFDRFYRVDQSRSKTVSGSGLGLSLAREIVLAHRGNLRLNPGPGNEVSFTLSLPCSSC